MHFCIRYLHLLFLQKYFKKKFLVSIRQSTGDERRALAWKVKEWFVIKSIKKCCIGIICIKTIKIIQWFGLVKGIKGFILIFIPCELFGKYQFNIDRMVFRKDMQFF